MLKQKSNVNTKLQRLKWQIPCSINWRTILELNKNSPDINRSICSTNKTKFHCKTLIVSERHQFGPNCLHYYYHCIHCNGSQLTKPCANALLFLYGSTAWAPKIEHINGYANQWKPPCRTSYAEIQTVQQILKIQVATSKWFGFVWLSALKRFFLQVLLYANRFSNDHKQRLMPTSSRCVCVILTLVIDKRKCSVSH